MDTGSEDTYYNLTGLLQNTTYYIRVLAVNYITSDGLPLRGNESETVSGIIIPEPGEGVHWWAVAFRNGHYFDVCKLRPSKQQKAMACTCKELEHRSSIHCYVVGQVCFRGLIRVISDISTAEWPTTMVLV